MSHTNRSRRTRAAVFMISCIVIQTNLPGHVTADGPYRTGCIRTALFGSVGNQDTAMKGHVISTVLVASPLTCSHACLKNNNCKSINYQHGTNTGRNLCELNSVTRDTHPGDLRPRNYKGYSYYQDVLPNEPCASWPCLNGACCKPSCSSRDYVCLCRANFIGKRCQTEMKSCQDWFNHGYTKNGVYAIDPDGQGDFNVYCDQVTSGGGWVVFQRRKDGSVSFDRSWYDYKWGFGDLLGEFWLGNEYIFRLTRSQTQLRVDLEDYDGRRAHAIYTSFKISSESDKYRLSVAGYSGNAGDSLAVSRLAYDKHLHNGRQFTTKDSDNDRDPHSNCAVAAGGAWWFSCCYDANLNGPYLGKESSTAGIVWWQWKKSYESLKSSEMKLK